MTEKRLLCQPRCSAWANSILAISGFFLINPINNYIIDYSNIKFVYVNLRNGTLGSKATFIFKRNKVHSHVLRTMIERYSIYRYWLSSKDSSKSERTSV